MDTSQLEIMILHLGLATMESDTSHIKQHISRFKLGPVIVFASSTEAAARSDIRSLESRRFRCRELNLELVFKGGQVIIVTGPPGRPLPHGDVRVMFFILFSLSVGDFL